MFPLGQKTHGHVTIVHSISLYYIPIHNTNRVHSGCRLCFRWDKKLTVTWPCTTRFLFIIQVIYKKSSGTPMCRLCFPWDKKLTVTWSCTTRFLFIIQVFYKKPSGTQTRDRVPFNVLKKLVYSKKNVEWYMGTWSCTTQRSCEIST